jgi:VWFA-related protein
MKRAPLILALLLGLQPGAAPSQPPPNPPERSAAEFGERIDVRAVEVVVVDAKGERVHGLKAEDFKLLVDGREERVDYFAEVAEGQAAPPAPAIPEPAAPVAATTVPSAPPSPPSVAAGGRVGTSYLVFVDEAFAVSSQRDAALSTLERDLALLGPGDRMAIVAYNGHGLTLLSPWSGDAAALRKAFAAAAKRKTWGARIVADRRGGRRSDAIDVQDLYIDTDLLGVNGYGLNQIWDMEQHASGVGRAATAAADALRGMPLPSGRRVMMVLAGGWPWDGDPRALRPLTSAANLLGYTLYPVHVAGYDPLM